MKIWNNDEERRESHARAYLAWRQSVAADAVTRGNIKPPAMFGLPAVGETPRPGPHAARKPKPRKRTFRATTAQHNAMIRRLHGKSWRPRGGR